MEKSGCVKIILDESKYSSPVPVIGLYIAITSLVCFLAILYDVVSGIRHRKRWLPCRLFSLNAVTLSLLAIAAKLPVDFTTPMPSVQDQLSKLTGTTIICTSMAFLLPSLGANENSECVTNMAALSIFVVTVVINMCIQIHTGVIFMFITEHIIIMCCMMFLLVVLWFSAIGINYHKYVVLDINKELLKVCQGSMFHRLKLAYMLGYNNNPQFLLCKFATRRFSSSLCILCFVIVIQATSRSLSFKVWREVSDYDWSVWIIVVTQILTISLASCATNFRRFALHSSTEYSGLLGKFKNVDYVIRLNPMLKNTLSKRCYLVTYSVMLIMLVLAFVILLPLEIMLDVLFRIFWKPRYENNDDIQSYKLLVGQDIEYDEWTLNRSVKDMKRWMEVSRSTNQPLSHLSQLLLKTHPSTRPMNNMEIRDQLHPDQPSIPVCSLSLVLLVRIAQVSLPSKLNEALVQTYNESHEIILFIETRTKAVTFVNQNISELAQAVWRGPYFISLLPKIFKEPTTSGTHQIQYDFDRALAIILSLSKLRPTDTVWEAIGFISAFVCRRASTHQLMIFTTVSNSYLLTWCIHYSLKLPQAIFKDVAESPAEEIDKRARHALQILSQITPLEDHIQWSFPVDCNISSLITTPVHGTGSQIETGGQEISGV